MGDNIKTSKNGQIWGLEIPFAQIVRVENVDNSCYVICGVPTTKIAWEGTGFDWMRSDAMQLLLSL